MGKTVILATGNESRGFTLIELVVVMAILMMLTAAFPIALDRFRPARQLRVYAQQTAADLRQQRAEAMMKGWETQVSGIGGANAYSMSPGRSLRSFPESVAMKILASAPGDHGAAGIRFFADGSSTGGSVELSQGEHSMRVEVDSFTGRVRVE